MSTNDMRKKLTFSLLFLLFLAGCVVKHPESDSCELACQNLNMLSCEEGKPIDMKNYCEKSSDCLNVNGEEEGQICLKNRCVAPCASFCVNSLANNIPLNVGCLKSIGACSEINQCN